MKKRDFTIVINEDEDGVYVADVPELKGCHTQAKSIDVLMKRVREGIELCLEVQKDKTPHTRFVGIQRIEVPG